MNNNKLHQELKSKEKVKIDNFEYKSFSEISKEFQNCKDVFAKLDKSTTSVLYFLLSF